MGIVASPLDTKRYFADPVLAEFADHVQRGDLAKVRAGLRAGINPNTRGADGFTFLFFVFPAKTADVARALLSAGADPNLTLNNGNPPLLFAVRMENADFTQALLESKADPNATGENEKPVIHEAVFAKAPKNVALLARAGADINKVWGIGTPLYSAIGARSFDAAASLLDAGAETDWRPSTGKIRETAGESFCGLMPRLKSTATNRVAVTTLFNAFARRGVDLACANDVQRFR